MQPARHARAYLDAKTVVTAPDRLIDPRFRALLSSEEWAVLPSPIRKRFSRRLAGGDSVTYRGQILDTRMSQLGYILSQVARLVGGPLPLSSKSGGPAVVTVTEDVAGNGQHWTRLYARRRGFPQVIHSSKRFAGPTGVEEHVGYGLGMALNLYADTDALVFRSAGYFLDFFGVRLAIPAWLTPGALTVTHREMGGGSFVFDLRIDHPRFGELIRQTAIFEETMP